jgi:hypothetical protein
MCCCVGEGHFPFSIQCTWLQSSDICIRIGGCSFHHNVHQNRPVSRLEVGNCCMAHHEGWCSLVCVMSHSSSRIHFFSCRQYHLCKRFSDVFKYFLVIPPQLLRTLYHVFVYSEFAMKCHFDYTMTSGRKFWTLLSKAGILCIGFLLFSIIYCREKKCGATFSEGPSYYKNHHI